MFRFRDPKTPPRPPQPWHAHAKRCCGFAARNALLGAAAAAKASADAMKWAAERKPVPPPAPTVDPVPVFIVSPPPPVMAARRPAPRCGGTSSKVLPILAGALLVGFVVAVSGVRTSVKSVSAPPAPQNMARLSPAKLSEYAADNGVLGGAKAALKALEAKAKAELTATPVLPPLSPVLPIPPLPAPPPTPPDRTIQVALNLAPEPAAVKPKTAVRLTGVKSDEPHTNKETAQADALLVAQRKLADQFARLDPPLEATPSVRVIRDLYLRPDSVQEVRPTPEDVAGWKQTPGLEPNRFWVTLDVEVSDDSVL